MIYKLLAKFKFQNNHKLGILNLIETKSLQIKELDL